jgi:hypothetical protein
MKTAIIISFGIMVLRSHEAQAQTATSADVLPVARQLAELQVERTAAKAGTQPGTDSAVPITEAVLVGGKDGSSATARLGIMTRWGTRHWLTLDTRLTSKPPDSGLPVLSRLDGLGDGAELSFGGSIVRKPTSVVSDDGRRLIKACDDYYLTHPGRRPNGYVTGQCTVDEENEGDNDLLRAIAPFVDAGWGLAVSARVTLSRPTFKYRTSADAATESESKQQTALKFSASFLTPSNVRASGFRDVFASWFVTFEGGLGNDWDSARALNLCRPVDNSVASQCESVAVGSPFDQTVRTVNISARRYLSESIAIAPAWTRRWAERKDALPLTDGPKWRFDLPLYFLWTEDKKGLSGGVALSWTQDQGRQYSVFVGTLLPAFEFK